MENNELLIALIIASMTSYCNVRGESVDCTNSNVCTDSSVGQFCVEVPGVSNDFCDPCPIGQYQTASPIHGELSCTNCTVNSGNHIRYQKYILKGICMLTGAVSKN